MNKNKIYQIYQILDEKYCVKNWWKLVTPLENWQKNINNIFSKLNEKQRVEICLTCILGQNTTHKSAIKALDNLQKNNALGIEEIKNMPIETLKNCIKPAGYFNKKTKYLLEFIDFYEKLNGKIPKREELLAIKGVGEESADSILLYAFNQPEFKIDAYTKRILEHLEIISSTAKYKDMKNLMQKSLENIIQNKEKRVEIFQKYHALIVEHAKIFYSKKPYGADCMLKKILPKCN